MAYLDKVTVASTTYDIQDTKAQTDIGTLDGIIKTAGLEKIPWTYTNRYIQVPDVGETIDPTDSNNRVYSSSLDCTYISCSEGDQFTVNGTASGNTRVWAFINASNKVLEKETGDTYSQYKDKVITAPANAAKLILNNRKAVTPKAVCYYGGYIGEARYNADRALTLHEEISAIVPQTYIYSLPWARGSYYNGAYVLSNNTRQRRCIIGPQTADRGFIVRVDKGVRFWVGSWAEVSDVMTRAEYAASGNADVYIPKGLKYDISVAYTDETGYTDTDELYNELLGHVHFAYDEEIPPYWLAALPDIEYRAIEKLISAETGDAFFFVTDPHWRGNEKYSSAIIRKMSDDLRIRTVVCGGDYINSHRNTKREGIEEIKDYFASFGDMDVFAAIGNHDTNGNSNSGHPEAHLTANEMYSLIVKQNEKIGVSDQESGCSYIDNASQKIRYIQFPYWASNSVSDDAKAKIAEWYNALDGDWTVVLISHAYWNSGSVPEASETYAQYFLRMLADDKPEIAMWLVGHCHKDQYDVAEDDGKALLVVSTTTDSLSQNNALDSAQYVMTRGTVTEQAFDIVQVDTTEKLIYFTRVGAGGSDADRVYSYDQSDIGPVTEEETEETEGEGT